MAPLEEIMVVDIGVPVSGVTRKLYNVPFVRPETVYVVAVVSFSIRV
jgi:hypothetical protein